MRFRRFGNRLLIRLAAGEEIIESLKTVCRRTRVHCASFVGLGSITGVTLGLFRHGDKKFHSDVIPGVFTKAPLAGTVIAPRGRHQIHCRINLEGGSEIPSRGGQLNSAVVSDTCEIVLSVTEAYRPGEDFQPLDFAA